jgi:hypothetical protein
MKPLYIYYHIYDNISLNTFYQYKCFRLSCRKTQNTHFIFNNFFSKSRAVNEVRWKNAVERDRPEVTTWNGTSSCHVGELRLRPFRILIVFRVGIGYANAPQYYVICALSVVFVCVIARFL